MKKIKMYQIVLQTGIYLTWKPNFSPRISAKHSSLSTWCHRLSAPLMLQALTEFSPGFGIQLVLPWALKTVTSQANTLVLRPTATGSLRLLTTSSGVLTKYWRS
ncbi:hypothetical protein L596_021775 [Steinernema carpocapsae]|uniref:Uncharacterized protein n=1 Tax=Steinernema carpocapsae TaxID=34508 RepID=A0A4U5MJR1_STECR|nr:hypothetical protein L596_021775 [Steinernema carpocapsae]